MNIFRRDCWHLGKNDLLYHRRLKIPSLKTGWGTDGNIAKKAKNNLFL